MKILIFNYEYPPLGGGGGRVSRDVAEGLAAKGHQVAVMTARQGELPERREENGVIVHRISCFRRHEDRCSVPEMAAYVVMGLKPAKDIATDFAPDVIHAHFAVPTGILARRIARSLNVPYVVTAHLGDVPGGVPEVEGLFTLADFFAKPVWRDAAASTAVSRFVRNLVRTAYQHDPKVIANGIDPASFVSTPSPTHKPVRLLFLGRFAEQKNPVQVVKAVWRLAGEAWTLDMVGDGPLLPKTKEAVIENGLKDQVTMHGWLDEDAVALFVKNADILIMPSRTEGLPMAGLQALAAGVAVIGTDAIADLVDEGVNGMIVPSDSKSIANAIKCYLDNSEALAQAKAASLQKARSFALPAVIDAYEGLLRDVSKAP